jgi:type IV pilus assembly protein PilC
MAQVATTDAAKQSKGAANAIRDFLQYTPGMVKPQEVILFCRQLASFVRVGVPVTTAIQTFAEQASAKRLKEAYLAVVADLEAGTRLSVAFAAHPRVFPGILTDMIRSAEITGNLDTVLRQAAQHIEREASARRKIRAAMTYPVIIAGFATVLTVGIIVFVLPQFTSLYAALGVKVPGILSALLGLSAYVSAHALAITLAVLIVVVGMGLALRTNSGRYFVDRLLLRIPVIAPMIRSSMIERFCRTLGDMLGAGVPISQTYGVVIANVRNRCYRRALEAVGPALAAGHGLYRPLQQSGVFTPAVVQMFRVGEETGHLDNNLTEAADMYQEELDYRLKRFTSFLEPAMIVFVGLMVGFIAVTLITSIYSLAGGFK